MIRLKRKTKDDDFPEDVCAAFKCEESSEITLGAGVLRPFAVPLCDKHNAKRCKEEEEEEAAAAAEPAAGPESTDAKLAREAAWRAKMNVEKTGKAPELDPVIEPVEDGPPDLEAFINAPLNEESKPKRKPKARPKPIDGSNGNRPIPINLIKRALIGAGVSSAEIVELGRKQINHWMEAHLPAEDQDRILDNARRLNRTPR